MISPINLRLSLPTFGFGDCSSSILKVSRKLALSQVALPKVLDACRHTLQILLNVLAPMIWVYDDNVEAWAISDVSYRSREIRII